MRPSLQQRRIAWFRDAYAFFIRNQLAPLLIATVLTSYFGVEWLKQHTDPNLAALASSWMFGYLEWPFVLRFLALLPFGAVVSIPMILVSLRPFPGEDD